MSVIQFLTHMGFDVQRIAQQQGMEASTLLGMLNNGNWAMYTEAEGSNTHTHTRTHYPTLPVYELSGNMAVWTE